MPPIVLLPVRKSSVAAHNRFVAHTDAADQQLLFPPAVGWRLTSLAVPQPGCDRFPGWIATLNLGHKGPGIRTVQNQ